MAKWRRILVGGIVVVVAGIGIHSWLTGDWTEPLQIQQEAADDDANKTDLTLRDVTLEQPDEDGKLLWRVKGSEVTYSPNQEVAYVKEPDGELFQDGEVIYEVTADTGEIRDNGNVILLRGNIKATGLKNDSILRGNELEWRPEEDILIVREQITGTHPKIRAVANEARVYNRQNRMELLGNVVANTVVKDPKTEPWLKLQANELVWFWEEERIESPQALRVEQFENETITEVVSGQQGRMNLAAQRVFITNNVVMQLLKFPLNVATEGMEWQVPEGLVVVNQPLSLYNPEAQIRAQARQGQMNLNDQQVTLSQDVVAQGQRNQSRLTADQMNWNVESQVVVAEGQVNYQQVDPTINLNGSRAVGRLDQQTVVVDGGRVVTEIVPN
jgi:LPS export ABC transporter protein LptC